MRLISAIAIASLLIILPSAASIVEPLDGPVENGSFESPFVPPEAEGALAGTPADACIGIGHQVFYGSETVPGQLTGGPALSPDPGRSDPGAAAARIAEDPVDEAAFQAGYGHCEFSQAEGTDIVWLTPKERIDQPAMWSVSFRIPSTEFGYNFDDDPFDREARFIPDPDLLNHNLWQSYVGQPGVYTANFEALELTLEAGEVPSSAIVRVSLSGTPLDSQSPYLAGYQDCILTFGSEVLVPGEDGRISADPLDAALRNDPGDTTQYCAEAVDTFNDGSATEEEKRDALGRLRLVQISFWNWNTGEDAVVIDDVAMPGATLFAEEAAEGNLNPDPKPGLSDA